MTIYGATYDATETLFEAGSQYAIQLGLEERHTRQVLLPSALPVPLPVGKEVKPEWGAAEPYGTPFFVATQEQKRKPYVIIPELEGIYSPILTSKVRHLAHTFWAIVASKSLQTSLAVKKAAIGIFSDPAEDRQQVVLRLFVDASATQAVAFWESLESDIEEWLAELSESDRLTFLRDISMRVHWQ